MGLPTKTIPCVVFWRYLPNLYHSCIASLLGQPFHNVATKTRSRSAFFKFHTMLILEENLSWLCLFTQFIFVQCRFARAAFPECSKLHDAFITMSFVLLACCYIYFASALVAVGKKRTRHHVRTKSQITKRKRSCVSSFGSGSDSEDDQEETKAIDINIEEVGYKRMRQIHEANASAFYQRASRMTCVSKTSFTDMQCLAESTCQDAKFNGQAVTTGSMMLASLGTFGKYPQNCERDYHRMQKRVRLHANINLDITYEKIEMKTCVGNKVEQQEIGFLLPHEVLAFLHEHQPAWEHAILGGDDQRKCSDFWQFYADNNAEWYLAHPVSTLSPEDRAKTIPIGLHGDDVHVYKTSARHKAVTMCWNSVFAHHLGSMLSRFCLFMLPYEKMVPGSLNQALEIISWSLQACFRGEWPMFRHDGGVPTGDAFRNRGKKIASGFRMALSQIRGDMKFLKELFMFKSSYAHNNCCHRCVASKVIAMFSFKNVFLPYAQWLNNMYTHESIMEKCFPFICSLAEIEGFHFSRVLQDALHGLNLGPAAHMVGGTLALLSNLGRTRDIALMQLWNRFHEWCREHHVGHCVPTFTSGMISMASKKGGASRKVPEWKCKAHNCRLVAMWLSYYTDDMLHIPEMLLANVALRMVTRFFGAMERHGRFLSQENAEAMKKDGLGFLAAYAACHKWALEKDLPHFPMKPKFHAFAHMVYDLEGCENPRFFHCFGDEDYMGVVAAIAKGCHRKTFPKRGMQRLLSATIQDFLNMDCK